MKKTEFILSSEIKCPKSGIFTTSYWVGKVILQVSVAVFSGTVKKFLGKDGSAYIEKIGSYAYGDIPVVR